MNQLRILYYSDISHNVIVSSSEDEAWEIIKKNEYFDNDIVLLKYYQ